MPVPVEIRRGHRAQRSVGGNVTGASGQELEARRGLALVRNAIRIAVHAGPVRNVESVLDVVPIAVRRVSDDCAKDNRVRDNSG